MYGPRQRIIVKVCVVFAGIVAQGPLAVASAAESWKTGAELRKQLDSGISVSWEGIPLRRGLTSLAQKTGVAIWLDRRVDPDQRVDFTSGGGAGKPESTELTLRRLASHLQLGLSQVGPVIYLGPQDTAARLATVASQKGDLLRALPPARRTQLVRAVAREWPEVTAPRDLLEAWAKDTGCKFTNLDALPHDVWAAGDYPPLTSAEYLSLLLAGFERSFDLSTDGVSVGLAPFPQVTQIERTYNVTDSVGVLAQLRQIYADVEVKSPAAGKVLVKATAEQHAQIERLLKGEKVTRTTVGPEKNVYSLTIADQPLGGVAKALAAKLGLEYQPDPRIAEKLTQRISFTVDKVSREALLKAMVEPAGVTYRVEGMRLLLLPKE